MRFCDCCGQREIEFVQYETTVGEGDPGPTYECCAACFKAECSPFERACKRQAEQPGEPIPAIDLREVFA